MQPIEVHISGPSGSGKSYLGEQLRNSGFYVVDMDDFFQPGDGRFELLKSCTDFNERSQLWHHLKNECFAHHKNTNKTNFIIWVGLTDHAANPEEPFYDMNVEYKFFIDISDSDLCRQYYTRLVNQKDFEVDWLTVASSRDVVATSSMKKIHAEHGYITKNQKSIFDFIMSLKKC